jgi:hypothetical protein
MGARDECYEVALEQTRIFVTGLMRLRRLDDGAMNQILEQTRRYRLNHNDPDGFEAMCRDFAPLLYPDVIEAGRGK